MANGVPPWRFGSFGPADFGYLGWTVDPEIWQVSVQPTGGVVFLTRMRAAATGVIANIDYYVGTVGAGLTTGLLGVYDTGQTTAGTATLIATSADQSSAATATGALTAAVSAGGTVKAGTDYLVAQLWAGTTVPTLATGTRFGTQQGLSGINLRGAKFGNALTALPATIASGSFVATGAGWYGMVCR